MKMKEDYYGFYDKDFLPAINQTLDDMFVETCPYRFKDEDISFTEYNPKSSTPVHLLNSAWYKFYEDPTNYSAWEEEAIQTFWPIPRKLMTKT